MSFSCLLFFYAPLSFSFPILLACPVYHRCLHCPSTCHLHLYPCFAFCRLSLFSRSFLLFSIVRQMPTSPLLFLSARLSALSLYSDLSLYFCLSVSCTVITLASKLLEYTAGDDRCECGRRRRAIRRASRVGLLRLEAVRVAPSSPPARAAEPLAHPCPYIRVLRRVNGYTEIHV